MVAALKQELEEVGSLAALGIEVSDYSSNRQPSTLNPQPSTLNPQPSTLNLQPSTLNPQPLTLNPQPSTCTNFH